MRVKKYRANNLPEAMKLIRADLGPDALIIHSQKMRPGGWLGWSRQPILEVTAAVDTDLRDFPQPTPGTDAAIQQLQHELATLKQAVSQVTPAKRESDLPTNLEEWYQRLLQWGIASPLARQIICSIVDELNWRVLDNHNTVNQHLQWQLKRRLPLTNLSLALDRSQVVFVVGSTGVGKTTTIAKLAAAITQSSTHHPDAKDNLLIITTDTFRLGAIPQIVTFGEILGVPVEAAYTPVQLAALVQQHRQHRVILVDTPGRSQHDVAALAELGDYLSVVPDKLVHLTLAAGTQYDDMWRTVEAFRSLEVDSLIFTKLDETSSLGPAYTLACETGLPLSYFTTGQCVPEDIEAATAERLVNFMIGQMPVAINNTQNSLITAIGLRTQNLDKKKIYELPN
jgi:flagellar biosynthesis protein FlhF